MIRALRRPRIGEGQAATMSQHRRLDQLARRAGVERPQVITRQDASDAIERLEERVRQEALF